jgi:peptidoglycan/LPS O-acetylase OafA/YrhL
VGLLLSISQMPRLRTRVFESRACQYLARISFALYLVHEFCLVVFGLRLQGWMVSVTGVGEAGAKGGLGYWVVCVVWFAVFTVPVFALAAQVERWVDVPSVRFAKELEERGLRVFKGLRGR